MLETERREASFVDEEEAKERVKELIKAASSITKEGVVGEERRTIQR
jgi:hypothetical protein